MESLLIPLLILALVGAGVLLAARAFSRRGPRSKPEAAPETGRDPVELARARESIWTPEKEKPEQPTKLWTPGSKETA